MTTDTIPVEPVMIERHCGGWLAVTPDSGALRLGVAADTEDEARDAFAAALERSRTIASRPESTSGE